MAAGLMEQGPMPHFQFNLQSRRTSIGEQDFATTTEGASLSIILSAENGYDPRPSTSIYGRARHL
jgi:hypothetical protein